MPTVSTKSTTSGIKAALQRLVQYRTQGLVDRPEGMMLLKFTRTLTAAETLNFDDAGDILEIGTLPTNFWVDKVNCTISDHDSGTQCTMDLMLGSTVLVNDSALAQTGGTLTYSGALLDGSSQLLKLKIEAAPQTPVTSFTYTCIVLGYYGAPVKVTA